MSIWSRLRQSLRDKHDESLSDREITMRQRVERRRRLGVESKPTPQPVDPNVVDGLEDENAANGLIL